MPFSTFLCCCDPNTVDHRRQKKNKKLVFGTEKHHARLAAVLEEGDAEQEPRIRYSSPSRISTRRSSLRYQSRRDGHRLDHLQDTYPDDMQPLNEAARSSYETHETQETLPAYNDTAQDALLLRSDYYLDEKPSSEAQAGTSTSRTHAQTQPASPSTTQSNSLPNQSDIVHGTSSPTPELQDYRTFPYYYNGMHDNRPTPSDRSSIISVPSTHLTDLTVSEIPPTHTGRTSISSSYVVRPIGPIDHETPRTVKPPSIPIRVVSGGRNEGYPPSLYNDDREADTDGLLERLSRPPSYDDVQRRGDEVETHPVMAADWLQRLRSAARRDRDGAPGGGGGGGNGGHDRNGADR